MRFVIQRVKEASVAVEGAVVARIGKGLLAFVGFDKDDSEARFDTAIEKILSLRIFGDENGKMNLSVKDISGAVLLVSQFTLSAEVKKGTRPSFERAMGAAEAKTLYDAFVKRTKMAYRNVEEGVFQVMMDVSLVNDGPVTLIYEV